MILAGGAWWVYSSRAQNEKEARAFAQEMADHLAHQLDRKFLDQHMAPERQTHYPPSYRDRIIDQLRNLGPPIGEMGVTGDVTFTSEVFDPRGRFTARLNYASGPAEIYYAFSRPHGWWQIDGLNLNWSVPHYTPPPAPSVTRGPSA